MLTQDKACACMFVASVFEGADVLLFPGALLQKRNVSFPQNANAFPTMQEINVVHGIQHDLLTMQLEVGNMVTKICWAQHCILPHWAKSVMAIIARARDQQIK